jgi:hypothetical protein
MYIEGQEARHREVYNIVSSKNQLAIVEKF